MTKEGIPIKQFKGLNSLHTRDIVEPSSGKNFRTVGGRLKTRPRLSLFSDVGYPIRSLHSVKMGQVQERLLAETSNGVYTYDNGWDFRTSDIGSNYGFTSALWRSTLILAGGMSMLVYDAETDELSEDFTSLGYNGGDEDLITSSPRTEGVVVFKGRPFLFGPHFDPVSKIRFCGYKYKPKPEVDDGTNDLVVYYAEEEEVQQLEIDDIDIYVWPERFAIPVPDGGEVLGAVVTGSSCIFLTTYGLWHLYGSSEDDFEIINSGSIGCYGIGCVQLVNDTPVWLGSDKRVYIYNGSVTESISTAVDEYLSSAIKSSGAFVVRCYKVYNQFWVVTSSKVFVYDFDEASWFIYEFPVSITGVTMYDDDILLGDSTGKLYRLSESLIKDLTTTDVTTEFIVGPMNLDSVKWKLKRIWLNADPSSNFSLYVYATVDGRDEALQGTMSFTKDKIIDQQVKFRSIKGKNVSVRFTTTDIVDSLQHGTLVVIPKAIK